MPKALKLGQQRMLLPQPKWFLDRLDSIQSSHLLQDYGSGQGQAADRAVLSVLVKVGPEKWLTQREDVIRQTWSAQKYKEGASKPRGNEPSLDGESGDSSTRRRPAPASLLQ